MAFGPQSVLGGAAKARRSADQERNRRPTLWEDFLQNFLAETQGPFPNLRSRMIRTIPVSEEKEEREGSREEPLGEALRTFCRPKTARGFLEEPGWRWLGGGLSLERRCVTWNLPGLCRNSSKSSAKRTSFAVLLQSTRWTLPGLGFVSLKRESLAVSFFKPSLSRSRAAAQTWRARVTALPPARIARVSPLRRRSASKAGRVGSGWATMRSPSRSPASV